MTIKQIRKNGKIYDIRTIEDGDGVKVRIFDNETNRPVSELYSTIGENINDLKAITGEDMINKIVEIAENDFLKKEE